MDSTPPHISVLPDEVLAYLAIKPAGSYIDCTAGAGGHGALILEQLGETGRLLALDQDPMAATRVRERFAEDARAIVVQANYGGLAEVLAQLGWSGADGVLIDAGCSSMQLDERERGFSFEGDGPLDMRMNPEAGESASEWLAHAEESEIATVLKEYGDVKPAKRIAKAIRERALRGALERTVDLADAVSEALPFVGGRPAEVRTVFQAIRIRVNDELTHLRQGIEAAADILQPGGRLAVISFHSGEDRVVKNVLRDASRPKRELAADGRVRSTTPPLLRLLTRQPVTPGEAELLQNPRAASAKLRAAERRTEATS